MSLTWTTAFLAGLLSEENGRSEEANVGSVYLAAEALGVSENFDDCPHEGDCKDCEWWDEGDADAIRLRIQGDAYESAVAAAEAQRVGLVGVIRMAAKGGMSESQIARCAGVQRMTVRKALGK